MTVTLPETLQYGKVVGRFLLAVGDTTADPDNLPDAEAALGSIVFSPVVPITKELSADPPVLVSRQPVPAKIDSSGFLVDLNDAPGVWLITGDWRVNYTLSGVALPTKTITITTAHTDLAPFDLINA